MAATPECKPKGMVAFDVECTGTGVHDLPYEVSFTHFPIKEGPYVLKDFTTRTFVMNLGRGFGETWKEVWERRGFSMWTFEDFFVKFNVFPLLDQSQQHPTAQEIYSPDVFARYLHNYLRELESIYSSVQTCSDTAEFDRAALCKLFQEHNLPLLHYDRTTGHEYHSNIYTGEILRTLHAIHPGDLSEDAFYQKFIKPHRLFLDVENDHDSEHDALNIAADYVALQTYMRDLRRSRQTLHNVIFTDDLFAQDDLFVRPKDDEVAKIEKGVRYESCAIRPAKGGLRQSTWGDDSDPFVVLANDEGGCVVVGYTTTSPDPATYADPFQSHIAPPAPLPPNADDDDDSFHSSDYGDDQYEGHEGEDH